MIDRGLVAPTSEEEGSAKGNENRCQDQAYQGSARHFIPPDHRSFRRMVEQLGPADLGTRLGPGTPGEKDGEEGQDPAALFSDRGR